MWKNSFPYHCLYFDCKNTKVKKVQYKLGQYVSFSIISRLDSMSFRMHTYSCDCDYINHNILFNEFRALKFKQINSQRNKINPFHNFQTRTFSVYFFFIFRISFIEFLLFSKVSHFLSHFFLFEITLFLASRCGRGKLGRCTYKASNANRILPPSFWGPSVYNMLYTYAYNQSNI